MSHLSSAAPLFSLPLIRAASLSLDNQRRSHSLPLHHLTSKPTSFCNIDPSRYECSLFHRRRATPKPFSSHICDDFTLESEKFLDLCSKTLIDADLLFKNTSSLISTVCKALDESEMSIFVADPVPVDFDFDPSFVPETEFEDISFVPETEFEDISFVPETEFDDTSFVPDSEFEDFSFGMETEFEGGVEACGGDSRISKAEPSSVTAEEMMGSSPLSPTAEMMMRILLPLYFTLVRSFPYILLVEIMSIC